MRKQRAGKIKRNNKDTPYGKRRNCMSKYEKRKAETQHCFSNAVENEKLCTKNLRIMNILGNHAKKISTLI